MSRLRGRGDLREPEVKLEKAILFTHEFCNAKFMKIICAR